MYIDWSSKRLGQADLPGECRKPGLAREAIEHRVEIVQRVADLVQLIRRLLLEEEADVAARLQEVAVARMALVAGREDRPSRAGIEACHQLARARLQGVAGGGGHEIRQHQEAVAPIGGELIRDHSTIRSITTGRPGGAGSPMRIALRSRAIASSASASLAA
jgi:hypothetical protein